MYCSYVISLSVIRVQDSNKRLYTHCHTLRDRSHQVTLAGRMNCQEAACCSATAPERKDAHPKNTLETLVQSDSLKRPYLSSNINVSATLKTILIPWADPTLLGCVINEVPCPPQRKTSPGKCTF